MISAIDSENTEMLRFEVYCVMKQTAPVIEGQSVFLLSAGQLLHMLNHPVSGRYDVVVTDDRKLAKLIKSRYQETSVCVIGLSEPRDDSYFDGADQVFYDLRKISRRDLETAAKRHFGIPVTIAVTDRLIIRESCGNDFDDLYRISREPGNDRFTETMSEEREEEKQKYLSYIRNQYHFYGFGLWTVVRRKDGAIIGRCGLMPYFEDDGGQGDAVEIGYLISTGERGKGYAKEACTAILDYAGALLSCGRIIARIHAENVASVCLAERLGFIRSGENQWQLLTTDRSADGQE